MAPLDLDTFLAMPRVGAVAVSRDGGRVTAEVAIPAHDRSAFTSALWAFDPEGAQPPRRLTWSSHGERAPAFTCDGDLLFLSTRPDGDDDEPASGADDHDDGSVSGLWLLPADGGEARLLVRPPAGVDAFAVAADAPRVVVAARVHPGAASFDDDEAFARRRREAGTRALLFDRYPIRLWDHWLGPRQRRLWVGDIGDGRLALRDLTPAPGGAFDGLMRGLAITPDGGSVLAIRMPPTADPDELGADLVAIDASTGAERVLIAGDGRLLGDPACSSDGGRVACTVTTNATPTQPPDVDVAVVDLATGDHTRHFTDVDRWPDLVRWSDDGSLLVVADDEGVARAWRVELDGAAARLPGDHSISALATGAGPPFAVAAPPGRPPVVVRLRDGWQPLPTPGDDWRPDAATERVRTTVPDGTQVGGWLVAPGGAGPHPLVLCIHGGPLNTWSGWHWRWNAHVLAGAGYAVLLADPALSTGYGRDFVRRGWGAWGDAPYRDLMALVEVVGARDDIDDGRVAVAGGSFGGYMANWIAGHTTRFRAIVTHASIWHLRAFHQTTDLGPWWEREFGDPYVDPSPYEAHSPHRHVAAIRTPMLVIHGEHDQRVPISEGVGLWTDLMRQRVDARFLYFPDEHHWITKPGNVRVWYETVLSFLDHHVRDQPWRRPDLL